jgi:hypothetical protein
MSSRAVAVRSISLDCSSPSRVMFRGSIRRARSKTRLIEEIEGHRVRFSGAVAEFASQPSGFHLSV